MLPMDRRHNCTHQSSACELSAHIKLLDIKPGYYWDGWPLLFTGNQPPRPTQPPTLSEMRIEYLPKGSEALRAESKGSYGWTCGWQVNLF